MADAVDQPGVRVLHKIGDEPFPNLLEPSDYFKKYMIRQRESATKGIPPGASYAVHTRFYQELKIWTLKVLHQGRGQSQREADEADVSLDDIKRLAHYLHDEQVLFAAHRYRLHVAPQDTAICRQLVVVGGGWINKDAVVGSAQ